MAFARFNKTLTRDEALLQSKIRTTTFFIPTDSNAIIVNGKEMAGASGAHIYNIRGSVADMTELEALVGVSMYDVYNVRDKGDGTGGYYQYIPSFEVDYIFDTISVLLNQVALYSDDRGHSFYGVITDTNDRLVNHCDANGNVYTGEYLAVMADEEGEFLDTIDDEDTALSGNVDTTWVEVGLPDLSAYATTAAVTTALNAKVTEDTIAEPYVEDNYYDVGNFMMWNGYLYRCTEAHQSSLGEPDFTKFERVVITEEYKSATNEEIDEMIDNIFAQ